MNRAVFLADTAVASLREIKFYQREAALGSGISYIKSEARAQAFVEDLVKNSIGQISDGKLQWAYDSNMADRGIKIKRYYDAKTDYICFFDDESNDIAVIYYASPRQNYSRALYRLLML